MLVSDETPTLNDICNYYGYTMDDILGEFPIWDESKRGYVTQRVYDHFRYRRIGSDTPAKFAFFMQRKMNEVMPQLNRVFSTLETDFDPTAQTVSKTRAVGSTFPQVQLHGNSEYADTMTDQDTTVSGNPATSLMNYYTGINNGLTLLYAELEPCFYQFWEED